MKLYILLLTLITRMHMSIAVAEFHKESVPACGKAFLATDQTPDYYDRNTAATYEAVKHQNSRAVAQSIYPKILVHSKELGQSRLYFQECVSKKYDKKDEDNLEKYGKCRQRLPLKMEEATSKALAANLPDTTTGLEKACAALDKYKDTKDTSRVKRFESCLKS